MKTPLTTTMSAAVPRSAAFEEIELPNTHNIFHDFNQRRSMSEARAKSMVRRSYEKRERVCYWECRGDITPSLCEKCKKEHLERIDEIPFCTIL